MIPSFTRVSVTTPSGSVEPQGHVLPAGARSARVGRVVGWLAELTDRTGLYLLHAAIVVLLVRPADLFPFLDNAPIYETLIVACLLTSIPVVVRHIAPAAVRSNAAVMLAFLLVPAVMLSHLSQANTYDARLGGIEMLKAFLMYVLVVGHVDSVSRLKAILLTSAASVLVVTALALLHFFGLFELPALASVAQRFSEPGQSGMLMRLCGVGIFNDPNDFALILVMAICVAAWALGERTAWWWKVLLGGAIGLFGYALFHTHSRGGLLAGVFAIAVFLHASVGWKRALPMALVAIPALLMAMSRRQTSVNLDNPEDTFQTRLGLWSDALQEFRGSPITGIGQGKLVDAIGQVAHNSFLQAFAEMGVLGGVAFLGAFYLVARGVWRATPHDRDLRRLRPCVLAILIGYVVGMLSLSRCYTVPTQMILGIATAFVLIRAQSGRGEVPAWGLGVAARVTAVGGIFLVATHLFVRVMLHRGGF